MRLTKNPDVWLQSSPTQNHQLKAWQKWASMYELSGFNPNSSSEKIRHSGESRRLFAGVTA
ncbi:MAG: hypothetical protein Q8O58_11900, partial [Gallionella sp.]|nr:hypothetical protein [Gallionella sp.]